MAPLFSLLLLRLRWRSELLDDSRHEQNLLLLSLFGLLGHSSSQLLLVPLGLLHEGLLSPLLLGSLLSPLLGLSLALLSPHSLLLKVIFQALFLNICVLLSCKFLGLYELLLDLLLVLLNLRNLVCHFVEVFVLVPKLLVGLGLEVGQLLLRGLHELLGGFLVLLHDPFQGLMVGRVEIRDLLSDCLLFFFKGLALFIILLLGFCLALLQHLLLGASNC